MVKDIYKTSFKDTEYDKDVELNKSIELIDKLEKKRSLSLE